MFVSRYWFRGHALARKGENQAADHYKASECARQDVASLDSGACFLLDVHLPGMSGIELCRIMRRQGVSAPVVFMTGRDDPAIRRAAEEQGCLAYMRKPFDDDRLIDAITQAVRR
jgi:FixJ family two-component response regulator